LPEKGSRSTAPGCQSAGAPAGRPASTASTSRIEVLHPRRQRPDQQTIRGFDPEYALDCLKPARLQRHAFASRAMSA
jgi:hypothetical protein